MPSYTVEAFRWTGTGYNALYSTSYTAVLTDNDPNYEGGGDADEQVTIEGAGPYNTGGTPYIIDVSFTDINGFNHVEPFFFIRVVGGGGWYFIPEPGSAFSVGATLGSYQGHVTNWEYSDVICFTPGTLISTPTGDRPVETLNFGDLVITQDNGIKAVRWVGRKKISGARLYAQPNLKPVTIRENAFGPGCPSRDMDVSPQHKILVTGPQSRLLFGQDEVLVPAKGLVNDHSIIVDLSTTATEYIHVLFDQHEVVFSDGLPTESFHPGHMGLGAIEEAARSELFELFPELKVNPNGFGPAARTAISVKEATLLVQQRPM